MPVLGLADKRDWESTFSQWAQSPGKTEEEKCERAINAIQKAIGKSAALASRSVTVFAQGSYRNRTNVRHDSDVDVCVLCDNTFFFDLADTASQTQFRPSSPAEYGYDQYKSEVEAALVAHFGRQLVKRGDKAFNIHENTNRIDADVVACFEFKQYYRDGGGVRYHSGTALVTDKDGIRVTNFPVQQFENGQHKNLRTVRRFRAIVRIIKCLRNEMEERGHLVPDTIPSYLIESLVWNWPDAQFMQAGTYDRLVRAFLAWAEENTEARSGCEGWMMEVNNIKRLFGPHNKWTRDQVNAFVVSARNYIIGS